MKRFAFISLAALLLAAAFWFLPWPNLRYWTSFIFFWIIPAIAWVPLIERSGLFRRIESLILALGLNFALVPVITLIIAYLPGQNSQVLLFSVFSIVIFVPLVLLWFQSRQAADNFETPAQHAANPNFEMNWWNQVWIWLALVLILAAAMRLTYLGYSEFQGDEAAVLVRAARIMTGEDMVLFQHKKGPLELLLPMASWDFAGISNEWMARLPFAFASVLAVGAVFLYSRRQSSLFTAGVAGGLMAVEGYLVGFGRIVQYQSAVILLTSLALFVLLFYQRQGRPILILLSAIFFSVASWAHYDAVLFLPAGLLLILWRLKGDKSRWRHDILWLVSAGLIGLILVGIFYVPFLRGGQAEGTLFYVSGRIGNDQLFYNHLPSTIQRTFVYDSLYLLILVFFGLALQIIFTWSRWSRWGIILSVFLLLLFCSTPIFPQWWVFGGQTFAWLSPALLLLGSLFAPKQDASVRALWLWLGVPAVFYLYFVALPLTHVYTAVPGAVLLAASGIYQMVQWFSIRSAVAYRFAIAGMALLFIGGTAYTIVTFVSHDPEYVRQYPDSKIALFWTPYGDELPEEGLFGFPYQAGWKTVGYLMDSGALSGSYDSNEERDVTDYYMRRAMRFDCATPDIYVIAEDVQDEVNVRFDQIESDYQLQYVIEVNGQPRSRVFRQAPIEDTKLLAASNFDHLYDLGTTPEAVATASAAVVGQEPAGFVDVEGQLGDFAELIGYQLHTENAHPGGYIELILLWRALGSAPIDYQVFTHLHDGQTMRGQLDGQPVCNSAPTSRWQEGSFIVDPYRIPIHPESPTGSVPLTVGMYNLATLERVPAVQPSHPENANTIFIENVEIREGG